MTTQTVTFQTILDTARETPKAYKIWTGSFYPKSLVTVEHTGKTSRREVYGRGNRVVGVVDCPIVNITMPKWLANR